MFDLNVQIETHNYTFKEVFVGAIFKADCSRDGSVVYMKIPLCMKESRSRNVIRLDTMALESINAETPIIRCTKSEINVNF